MTYPYKLKDRPYTLLFLENGIADQEWKARRGAKETNNLLVLGLCLVIGVKGTVLGSGDPSPLGMAMEELHLACGYM